MFCISIAMYAFLFPTIIVENEVAASFSYMVYKHKQLQIQEW